MCRLAEAKRKVGGDLAKAEGLLRCAIDALAASDFHRTNGHDTWEKHLFPSQEKMEFWQRRERGLHEANTGTIRELLRR